MEHPDDLRQELHWALRDLKMIDAARPDAAFLAEFVHKGYYFVHAIKCWTEAKLPGFGRDARNRTGRADFSKPLLAACAAEHLFAEIEMLKPKTVCALGAVPFLVLRAHYALETKATPTTGASFVVIRSDGESMRLLYTCLPLPQKILDPATGCRRWAREIVRDHLANFGVAE